MNTRIITFAVLKDKTIKVRNIEEKIPKNNDHKIQELDQFWNVLQHS